MNTKLIITTQNDNTLIELTDGDKQVVCTLDYALNAIHDYMERKIPAEQKEPTFADTIPHNCRNCSQQMTLVRPGKYQCDNCEILQKKLTDFDLSIRALNCLRAADIETVADLIAHKRIDLLRFRNFGKKSLTEIENLVSELGLKFTQ